MNAPVGALVTALGLPSRVPVDPSRDEARAWAVEELSHREYQAAQPSLLQRVLGWLQDRLQSLEFHGGPGQAVLIGVVTVVVLALLGYVLYRAGGIGRQARTREAAVFEVETTRTPAEHRAAADLAASRGDWRTAVIERFRAVVRELEERTVLAPQPGRTADEAAREAGRLLPEHAAALRTGALLFDDVRYGDRPASAEGDAQLRALDDGVSRAKVIR